MIAGPVCSAERYFLIDSFLMEGHCDLMIPRIRILLFRGRLFRTQHFRIRLFRCTVPFPGGFHPLRVKINFADRKPGPDPVFVIVKGLVVIVVKRFRFRSFPGLIFFPGQQVFRDDLRDQRRRSINNDLIIGCRILRNALSPCSRFLSGRIS